MAIYTPPFYIAAVVDKQGSAGAYTFLSVFNPANSGRVHVALGFRADSYATGPTTVADSLQTWRISAVSGGSERAAANVDRFITTFPDPKTRVFFDNPTITTTGNALLGIPPVISTGTGESSTTVSPTPGASFVMLPGEGLAFFTETGDTDQFWNMQYVWTEKAI